MIPEIDVVRMRNLAKEVGYGEAKLNKLFPMYSLGDIRKVIKGINAKDIKKLTKHVEYNAELLGKENYAIDFQYLFHDGSIQDRHNARTVIPSTDGDYVILCNCINTITLEIKTKMFIQKDMTIDYAMLLNAMTTFNLAEGSIVRFDRMYNNLKQLETIGIKPLVVCKSEKTPYNSMVEATFGNTSKRIYRLLPQWTHTEKYKKRTIRVADITTEEMKAMAETILRAEYYNEGVEELESLLIWIKVVAKRRKVAVEQTATQ